MAVPPMLVPPGFVAGVPRRVRARLDGRDVADLRTTCPYKGTVSDHWSYETPDSTVVDVIVDGERQERPVPLQ